MRQSNPPHTGTGADIQHADRRIGLGDAQMFAQNLRCLVAQREQSLDKLGEKLLARSLAVRRDDFWLAGVRTAFRVQTVTSWAQVAVTCAEKSAPW